MLAPVIFVFCDRLPPSWKLQLGSSTDYRSSDIEAAAIHHITWWQCKILVVIV